MAIPAAVAHGGAGAGPERLANVERAIAIAAGILESGGSCVEAAVAACTEDCTVAKSASESVRICGGNGTSMSTNWRAQASAEAAVLHQCGGAPLP